MRTLASALVLFSLFACGGAPAPATTPAPVIRIAGDSSAIVDPVPATPARADVRLVIEGERVFVLVADDPGAPLADASVTVGGSDYTMQIAATPPMPRDLPSEYTLVTLSGSVCVANAGELFRIAYTPEGGEPRVVLAHEVNDCPSVAEQARVAIPGRPLIAWNDARLVSDPGAAVGARVEGEFQETTRTFSIVTPVSDDMLCPGTPAMVEVREGIQLLGALRVEGRLVHVRGELEIDGDQYVIVEWGRDQIRIGRVSDARPHDFRWLQPRDPGCDCCD